MVTATPQTGIISKQARDITLDLKWQLHSAPIDSSIGLTKIHFV